MHAFEAQRVIFHMLAGNMALNSMENVHCHFMAVGAQAGSARIPRLDYHQHGSFGSLELNREQQSDLGQQAIIGPIGGYDWLTLNQAGAYQNLGDPRADLTYTAVAGGGATGGSFTFSLYLPFEIVARDALGVA